MPRFLIRDEDVFKAEFPKAYAFMEAAANRKELYNYLNSLVGLNPYQQQRKNELLQSPACKEPWFLDMLSRESL